MLGVIPWEVADQEAVLPVERKDVGRTEVEQRVVPNLLRVHQADDRPDTLGYDPVDPLEDLLVRPRAEALARSRRTCGGSEAAGVRRQEHLG